MLMPLFCVPATEVDGFHISFIAQVSVQRFLKLQSEAGQLPATEVFKHNGGLDA